MCMSCGCGEINEKHGDERNITMDDFKKAAEAAGTSVDQVMENMRKSFSSGGKSFS